MQESQNKGEAGGGGGGVGRGAGGGGVWAGSLVLANCPLSDPGRLQGVPIPGKKCLDAWPAASVSGRYYHHDYDSYDPCEQHRNHYRDLVMSVATAMAMAIIAAPIAPSLQLLWLLRSDGCNYGHFCISCHSCHSCHSSSSPS